RPLRAAALVDQPLRKPEDRAVRPPPRRLCALRAYPDPSGLVAARRTGNDACAPRAAAVRPRLSAGDDRHPHAGLAGPARMGARPPGRRADRARLRHRALARVLWGISPRDRGRLIPLGLPENVADGGGDGEFVVAVLFAAVFLMPCGRQAAIGE